MVNNKTYEPLSMIYLGPLFQSAHGRKWKSELIDYRSVSEGPECYRDWPAFFQPFDQSSENVFFLLGRISNVLFRSYLLMDGPKPKHFGILVSPRRVSRMLRVDDITAGNSGTCCGSTRVLIDGASDIFPGQHRGTSLDLPLALKAQTSCLVDQ